MKELKGVPALTPPSGWKVEGTSHNKAVSARACMVCVPDLAPEIKVPAARHTDSLGDEHRQGVGLARVTAHRRRDC